MGRCSACNGSGHGVAGYRYCVCCGGDGWDEKTPEVTGSDERESIETESDEYH